MKGVLLFLCVVIILVVFGLPANQVKQLGQAEDWQAYQYAESKEGEEGEEGEKGLVCVLSSRALMTLPKREGIEKDQEAMFYITRSKGESGWFYELAVLMGMILSSKSSPLLRIGTKSWRLLSGAERSSDEANWSWVGFEDMPQVLAAMKSGYDMEVSFYLENEERLRDRYSLLGIKAGLKLLKEHCP